MKSRFNIKRESKDYHVLTIDGNEFTLERSELRELIQVCDNNINVGRQIEVKAMTSDEFMELVLQGRRAAENDDEECIACGS